MHELKLYVDCTLSMECKIKINLLSEEVIQVKMWTLSKEVYCE